MVSNALSGRYYFGDRPPICKQQPAPGPLPPASAPAVELHAYANWTDLDPLAPYEQQGMFALDRVGPGNAYHGRSSPSPIRLELDVVQIGSTPYWNITITTYDPGQAPEDFTWSNVYIDPNKPFDTRLLMDVTIPNDDYRIARVTL